MKEFDYSFKLQDGKVLVVAKYDGAGADFEVITKLEIEYFLEKLKGLIPGEIDDKVIDSFKFLLLK